MKQIILLLFIVVFISCKGQNNNNMSFLENNIENEVFSGMRLFLKDGTEQDIVTINEQFIQELSQPLKQIVARYAVAIPDYMLNDDEKKKLYNSIGMFNLYNSNSTTDWGNDFTLVKSPVYLTLTRKDDFFIFKYGFVYGTTYVKDKFEISEDGNIKFIEREEGDRFTK